MILLNTCSIREKAEDKVFSQLGALKGLKKARPDLVIGVMGCMAQLQQGRIQDRAPYVDLVFGSPAIARVGQLVATRSTGGAAGARHRGGRPGQDHRQARADAARRLKAFVTVMEGCEKHCTFCVVPVTRGPRAKPCPGRHRRGDPRARRSRLPRGDAARPDRQCLWARPRPADGSRRAPRAGRSRGGHRAHPLHDLESVQPDHPLDPGDPRRAEGGRIPPPAGAVGLGPRPRPDESRLHQGAATSS